MLERELLFEKLHVAGPCPVRWASLQGDARARFCPRCRREVYDLAAMSQSEAVELIRAHHRNLSTDFYRRDDGRIVTANCPAPSRAEEMGVFARSFHGVRLFAGVATVLLLLAAGVFHFAAELSQILEDPIEQHTGNWRNPPGWPSSPVRSVRLPVTY